MTAHTIHVAKDFSAHPAGRFRRHGPFTGEVFREDFLRPALSRYDKVVVDFTGVGGVRSSFLEEAFGGLVRCDVPQQELDKVNIVDPMYGIDVEVQKYILDALRVRANG